MGSVVVGVTVRADGARTEVMVARPTTVEAVVAGINSLIYLCPPELRPAALREVARLADPQLMVHDLPEGAVIDPPEPARKRCAPVPCPADDDGEWRW
jgi:hypothetical protein